MLCVFFLPAAAAYGQAPSVWKRIPGHERLKAVKAAQIAGQRKLLEKVFQTPLGANATVRDFALETDEIAAACRAFIQEARIKDSPRFLPEGTVEVRVAIPVSVVIENLKRICEKSYRGDRFHSKDFDALKTADGAQEFEEVGKVPVGSTPQGDLDGK